MTDIISVVFVLETESQKQNFLELMETFDPNIQIGTLNHYVEVKDGKD